MKKSLARLALSPLLLAATTAHASGLGQTGDLLAVAIPAAALGTTAFKKDPDGTRQLAASWLLAAGTTVALKNTVDARRPDGEGQSFPSGHAASAFAGAGFIERRYGWSYGLPAYAAAAFVAWSRVEEKEHYAIDVAAGAAVGLASSHLFTEPFHVNLIPGGAELRLSGHW